MSTRSLPNTRPRASARRLHSRSPALTPEPERAPIALPGSAAGTCVADISGTPLSQVLTTGGHHAHLPSRATSKQRQERTQRRHGCRAHLSSERSAFDRRRNKNQTEAGSQEITQETAAKLGKDGRSVTVGTEDGDLCRGRTDYTARKSNCWAADGACPRSRPTVA